jgi:predicted alpha/beta-fold hydrolase
VRFPRPPRTLYEFDDWYTAPVCGFGSADNYYARCSSQEFVPGIRLPTLILTAQDDPLIPFAPFRRLALPDSVRLQSTRYGGHMGFISCGGADPDRRWLDWRIVEHVTGRAGVACSD